MLLISDSSQEYANQSYFDRIFFLMCRHRINMTRKSNICWTFSIIINSHIGLRLFTFLETVKIRIIVQHDTIVSTEKFQPVDEI